MRVCLSFRFLGGVHEKLTILSIVHCANNLQLMLGARTANVISALHWFLFEVGTKKSSMTIGKDTQAIWEHGK